MVWPGDALGRGQRDDARARTRHPALKSFLQFNDGWPLNSWAVTENSNGYEAQYIRLLAAFAG